MVDESCIVEKFLELAPLSEEDTRLLAELEKDVQTYPAGHILKSAGQKNPPFFTLRSGWACSVRLLPDGQRQILHIFINSQIMGLSEVGADCSETELMALTDIEACPFTARDLHDVLSQSSRVSQLLMITMAREHSLLIERVMSIGKRRGAERLGHFLLEIRFRTKSRNNRIHIPFNQTVIADALGMSSVHVSRSFSELKKLGLLQTDGRTLFLPDVEALAEFSSFCPRYLEVGSADLMPADSIPRPDPQLIPGDDAP